MDSSDNSEIMKWLNQRVNELKPTESKEYILNSEYAGRKVFIQIKISAIKQAAKSSSTE